MTVMANALDILAIAAHRDDVEQTCGGTLLRMTHSGLPNEAQCAAHARGWAHYLGRLAIATAGGNPGIDQGIGSS